MSSDAQIDGMIDYAYWCMDQAGWKSVECPNCGCPRMQKGCIFPHVIPNSHNNHDYDNHD